MPDITDSSSCKLFTPLTIAEGLTLKNRVVFTPRIRAHSTVDTCVPKKKHHAVYYEQRAGAGLIISEATAVSKQGYGRLGAPALYTGEHAEGWRKIVERVHARGGKMFLQLGHMGRQSHSPFNSKREVASASATRCETGRTRNAMGDHVSFETARPLDTDEIADIVEMYHACAERAKQVGFDGVEVHGGNGYLVDQFLQSATNKRTDMYGGSFENRARLLLEIVDTLKTVWPANRIGVRLTPNINLGSTNNYEMFVYVMEQLGRLDLAYLAIHDGDSLSGNATTDASCLVTALDAKKAFKGLVMAINNSYTRDTAESALRSGRVDFVSFRRLHTANSEATERFPLLDRVENLLRAHFPHEISDLWSPANANLQSLEMVPTPKCRRRSSDRPRSRSKLSMVSSPTMSTVDAHGVSLTSANGERALRAVTQ